MTNMNLILFFNMLSSLIISIIWSKNGLANTAVKVYFAFLTVCNIVMFLKEVGLIVVVN